jgi:hypothetical protein
VKCSRKIRACLNDSRGLVVVWSLMVSADTCGRNTRIDWFTRARGSPRSGSNRGLARTAAVPHFAPCPLRDPKMELELAIWVSVCHGHAAPLLLSSTSSRRLLPSEAEVDHLLRPMPHRLIRRYIRRCTASSVAASPPAPAPQPRWNGRGRRPSGWGRSGRGWRWSSRVGGGAAEAKVERKGRPRPGVGGGSS